MKQSGIRGMTALDHCDTASFAGVTVLRRESSCCILRLKFREVMRRLMTYLSPTNNYGDKEWDMAA